MTNGAIKTKKKQNRNKQGKRVHWAAAKARISEEGFRSIEFSIMALHAFDVQFDSNFSIHETTKNRLFSRQ